MGVFSLGSVVRRTEPHVRYLFVAYVVRVFLLFFCATADFSMWLLCASQRGRQVKLACKKARPSGPPGGASLSLEGKVHISGCCPAQQAPTEESENAVEREKRAGCVVHLDHRRPGPIATQIGDQNHDRSPQPATSVAAEVRDRSPKSEVRSSETVSALSVANRQK